MSRPLPKRRLTLGKEFRNSVKSGPRVWLIVAGAFLCLVLLPLLSKLASLLAVVLVVVGLFFMAPVIISAVVGGLVNRFKQEFGLRVFTPVSGTAGGSSEGGMKQAGGTTPGQTGRVIGGGGKTRSREVIEVETVTEDR